MTKPIAITEKSRWERSHRSEDQKIVGSKSLVVFWIVACGYQGSRVHDILDLGDDRVEGFFGDPLLIEHMSEMLTTASNESLVCSAEMASFRRKESKLDAFGDEFSTDVGAIPLGQSFRQLAVGAVMRCSIIEDQDVDFSSATLETANGVDKAACLQGVDDLEMDAPARVAGEERNPTFVR